MVLSALLQEAEPKFMGNGMAAVSLSVSVSLSFEPYIFLVTTVCVCFIFICPKTDVLLFYVHISHHGNLQMVFSVSQST